MKTLTTTFLIVMISAAVLLTAGCPDRKSIADIERDPGRYQNKNVVVAGVVKDSYGLSIPGTKIGGGAYQIDDGTGTIWVLVTEGNVPSKGAQVGVKGRVGSGVNWKGRNYGLGIYEKERKYPKR
ncbi:hypothetical protein BH20ACI2_BH20ACI2_05390 [soil metagenome]